MNLVEAVKVKEECDPLNCDCDSCPIGKTVEYDIADSGVWLKSTICGMLLFVEDFIEQQAKTLDEPV